MSLFTPELVGDMLSEGSFSMFHLQSDEVKVMERMSTRNARRKISLPSPLPGIREIQESDSTSQSRIPIRKQSVIGERLASIDEDEPQNVKDSVTSHTRKSADEYINIKQKAMRRYSLTENYPSFPYLDPNKKCLGQSNINQTNLNDMPEERSNGRNTNTKKEDESDFEDEILLLPGYVLSLDSDAVETSLDPLLTLHKPKERGEVTYQNKEDEEGHWEVREASKQERTIWIFKGWNIRNI